MRDFFSDKKRDFEFEDNEAEKFEKLNEKLTNSIKNLEFTKEMLKQLSDNEKQGGKIILQAITKKNKTFKKRIKIKNTW